MGTYICIPNGTETETYPTDTLAEIEVAQGAMREAGMTVAEVWAGDPAGLDGYKNGQKIYAGSVTIDEFDALTISERREYADANPHEVAALLSAQRAACDTATRVGYWRPIADGPDYSAADRTAADLALVRAGQPPSSPVSAVEVAVAGAESPEQYLADRVARERAAADAEWELPVPVPHTLDATEAGRLAAWLDAGQEVASYRGSSRCRICNCLNGSAELEREGYRYPSGLAHYVREHHVAVPGLGELARKLAAVLTVGKEVRAGDFYGIIGFVDGDRVTVRWDDGGEGTVDYTELTAA